MGSSARRKREKKQDFQKAKLKVGKTKAKADNFTDTSFKAKSIVLNQQSLSTAAPTAVAQFSHQLSLVSSKTDSQRQDALAALTNTISNLAPGQPLPLPVATILPKIQPLVLDASKKAREQFLKLLRVLPVLQVRSHVDHMLLYVRAGMTHLASEIRMTALDALDWLLQIGPEEVVSCSGGWLKTLNSFMSLLGWQTAEKSGKWSSTKAPAKPGADSKLLVKQLAVLARFLSAGFKDAQDTTSASLEAARLFPLCGCDASVLYARSTPFRNLNLFGAARDAESSMYDDAEARKRAFDEAALKAVARGISNAKKEGGEVGRAASGLEKVLVDGMGDYEREE
ncbi:hypothetical protein AAFC00_000271 [Neodothiora populina]|uniref:Pre-rRNA-processing protein n=1 Tax=Neodothiora populina TaxID=2781224 RepID=A0ABR3PCE6_9PEZI